MARRVARAKGSQNPIVKPVAGPAKKAGAGRDLAQVLAPISPTL